MMNPRLARSIELAGKKQVPCLVVDGKPMHESKDINRFLYRAFCT